jgi:hypothetical protein
MHTLVEQMNAKNIFPTSDHTSYNIRDIYKISHEKALKEEAILLFSGKVDTGILYGGGVKRDPIYKTEGVYKIIYRNGKEQIAEFYFKLNDRY